MSLEVVDFFWENDNFLTAPLPPPSRPSRPLPPPFPPSSSSRFFLFLSLSMFYYPLQLFCHIKARNLTMWSHVNEWLALLNHTSAYVSIRPHTDIIARNAKNNHSKSIVLFHLQHPHTLTFQTPLECKLM